MSTSPAAGLSVAADGGHQGETVNDDVDMYETTSVYSDDGSSDDDDDEHRELLPKICLPARYNRKSLSDESFHIDQWLVQYVTQYNRHFTSRAEIDALPEVIFADADDKMPSPAEPSPTAIQNNKEVDQGDALSEGAHDAGMGDDSDVSDDSEDFNDDFTMDDYDSDEDGDWIPPWMTDEEYRQSLRPDGDAAEAGVSTTANDNDESAEDVKQDLDDGRGFSTAARNAFNGVGKLHNTIHKNTSIPCTFTNLSTSLSSRLVTSLFGDYFRQTCHPSVFGDVTFLTALLQHPIGYQAFADICCILPPLFQRWLKKSNNNALHLLNAVRLTLHLPFPPLLELVNAALTYLQRIDPSLTITHTAMSAAAADTWNPTKATPGPDQATLSIMVDYLITPFSQTQVDQLVSPLLDQTDPAIAPLLRRNFLVDNLFHLLKVLALITGTWPDQLGELPTKQHSFANCNRILEKWKFYRDADPALISRYANEEQDVVLHNGNQFDQDLSREIIDAILDQIVIYTDPTLADFRKTPNLIKFPQPPMSTSYATELNNPILLGLVDHTFFHLYIHQLLHSVAPTGDSKLLTILPLVDAHHTAYNNPPAEPTTATTTTTTTTLMEISALYPLTRPSTTECILNIMFTVGSLRDYDTPENLYQLHLFLLNRHAQLYDHYNLRNATSFKVYDGCEEPFNSGDNDDDDEDEDGSKPKKRPVGMKPNYYTIFLQHIMHYESFTPPPIFSTFIRLMGQHWNTSDHGDLHSLFFQADICGWRMQEEFKTKLTKSKTKPTAVATADQQQQSAETLLPDPPMHATSSQFLALFVNHLASQSVEPIKQHLALLHQQRQTDQSTPSTTDATSPTTIEHDAYYSRVLLVQSNKYAISRIYDFILNTNRLESSENYRIALFRSGLFPNWQLFDLVRSQAIDHHPTYFHIMDLDKFKTHFDIYCATVLSFFSEVKEDTSGASSRFGFLARPKEQPKEAEVPWEQQILDFANSQWAGTVLGDSTSTSLQTTTTAHPMLPVVDLLEPREEVEEGDDFERLDDDTGYSFYDEHLAAIRPSPYSHLTKLKLALDVTEFVFADFDRNQAAGTPWLSFWAFYLADRPQVDPFSKVPGTQSTTLATIMALRLILSNTLNPSQRPLHVVMPNAEEAAEGKRAPFLKV
jgi:hypothetical protein